MVSQWYIFVYLVPVRAYQFRPFFAFFFLPTSYFSTESPRKRTVSKPWTRGTGTALFPKSEHLSASQLFSRKSTNDRSRNGRFPKRTKHFRKWTKHFRRLPNTQTRFYGSGTKKMEGTQSMPKMNQTFPKKNQKPKPIFWKTLWLSVSVHAERTGTPCVS